MDREEVNKNIYNIQHKQNVNEKKELITERDALVGYFISEIEKAKKEVLDYIAFGEGWEETRDLYAEKLGLTVKYKK